MIYYKIERERDRERERERERKEKNYILNAKSHANESIISGILKIILSIYKYIMLTIYL